MKDDHLRLFLFPAIDTVAGFLPHTSKVLSFTERPWRHFFFTNPWRSSLTWNQFMWLEKTGWYKRLLQDTWWHNPRLKNKWPFHIFIFLCLWSKSPQDQFFTFYSWRHLLFAFFPLQNCTIWLPSNRGSDRTDWGSLLSGHNCKHPVDQQQRCSSCSIQQGCFTQLAQREELWVKTRLI